MATGQIMRLVTDRGFGFIQETGATEDIFFHSTSLTAGLFDQLAVGQGVEFDKGTDDRAPHKQRAVNVRPVAFRS
jgi:cold shock CspA family protein